jgi:hypothetical protein
MAGILDKKSRIIDFILTNNGRSQIESGDIRYRYATLSDSSIVYRPDFDLTKQMKSKISDSESYFLPIEAMSKVNDSINPEFDLRKYFSYSHGNILNNNIKQNSINFDAAVDLLLTTQTLAGHLKNLKVLSKRNAINSEKEISFIDTGFLADTIDFRNSMSTYKTISSYSTNKENLSVIALDKRFSNKRNYKVLIPKDISGRTLYEKSQFKNLDALDDFNTTGYVLSSYQPLKSTENVLSREKEILNVIKSLEADKSIHKKVYNLKDNSNENTFIFELHELDEARNKIEKISFIKLGDFYDKTTGSSKKVYLIGKVINTRNDASDLDTLFSFNNGEINLNSKSTFALSAYYSFITLFTLVVE